MGNPQNPARKLDKWSAPLLAAQTAELKKFARFGVISGGWAWHFLSPPQHQEYRILHDHKDIDFFAFPESAGQLIDFLKAEGYGHRWTKYDDPSNPFYRYTKFLDRGKIVLDLFVGVVPFRQINYLNIIEPSYLISLYGRIHSSDQCVAVQAARKLLKSKIDPLGRPELVALSV